MLVTNTLVVGSQPSAKGLLLITTKNKYLLLSQKNTNEAIQQQKYQRNDVGSGRELSLQRAEKYA
jgi:hypothetical protein